MRLTSDGRPSARKRGYTVRWEKAARRFLRKHPTCAMFGRDTKCTGIAKHVDHINPHRGDLRLFWDRRNWQGLCVGCHNRKTASERLKTPRSPLVDLNGMPTHWQ